MSFRLAGLIFWLTISMADLAAAEVIVFFKDKGPAVILNPSNYLSEKAIFRRVRQHIPIDETDLPVYPYYLNQLRQSGFHYQAVSKWLNAVYIPAVSPEMIPILAALPFVLNIYQPGKTISIQAEKTNRYPCETFQLPQRDMIGADRLHLNGFNGSGILICVMDNGFPGVPSIEGFSHLRTEQKIVATKNFLDGSEDVYHTGDHGTSVLSNLTGYVPGALHGTAYGASFLLARTEIDSIESPLEMFLWTQAAEWADSIGAAIFSTSLGYSQFDDPTKDYYYADMNGKTTIISKAAQIAADKGILVVNSAGNEGAKNWKYITAPGDAEGVITVGAVDSRKNLADFSSRGPTWDGRIKPDLVCQGVSNTSIGPGGDLYFASGTSFSCPVFAGFAACLMQAGPDLSVKQLKNIIYQNCSRSSNPDNDWGRGIPQGNDIFKSITGRNLPPTPSCDLLDADGMYIYPNPTSDFLYITFDNRSNHSEVLADITDISGKFLYSHLFPLQKGLQQFEISSSVLGLASGLYYIKLKDPSGYVIREQKWMVLR